MKQKRFRKLLMSKGYERNAVNEIVKETIQSGKPYAEAYKQIELIEKIDLSRAIDAFNEAIRQIQKIALAAAKAAGEFVKTFNEAMKEGEK